MVVVVDSVLPDIEQRRRMPVHAAVRADAGGPPGIERHLIICGTTQSESRDIGLPACAPVLFGVHALATRSTDRAVGHGAASVAADHDQSLSFGGQAFGAGEVERFGGVLTVDQQVVVRVRGEADEVAHRHRGAHRGVGDPRRGV